MKCLLKPGPNSKYSSVFEERIDIGRLHHRSTHPKELVEEIAFYIGFKGTHTIQKVEEAFDTWRVTCLQEFAERTGASRIVVQDLLNEIDETARSPAE